MKIMADNLNRYIIKLCNDLQNGKELFYEIPLFDNIEKIINDKNMIDEKQIKNNFQIFISALNHLPRNSFIFKTIIIKKPTNSNDITNKLQKWFQESLENLGDLLNYAIGFELDNIEDLIWKDNPKYAIYKTPIGLLKIFPMTWFCNDNFEILCSKIINGDNK